MTKQSSSLDTSFRTAEDSPGFTLWKAANVLQRMHADCLRGLSITPTQFSVMTCLVYLQASGPVTASRIVAHTGMDKMTVSDLLSSLQRKHLVVRTPNPHDARSSLVSATPAGRRTTNAAVRKIEELDARFFEAVEDPAALHAALLALVERAE